MRSCIYCGRDLEKDEKCNCPGAMRARQTKTESTAGADNTSEKHTENQYSGWQNNTYQTGYTKKKKKFKFKFKKPNFRRHDFRADAGAVKGFTRRFLHDPVNTVSSPGYLNPVQIVLILLITAVGLSLCCFFTAQHVIPGIYKLPQLLEYALYGTLSFTGLEFAFILVLFLINKFILRNRRKFMEFATAPVAAMIPLMLLSLVGAGINFFSIYATVMLVLTGGVMNIILTYEAMRSEWSFAPATRIMYLIGISYFLFFVVAFNLIRLF